MKFLMPLIFFMGTLCFAEEVISEKIVSLPVDIGKAKLKFTNLGYGQTYFVKIIVPELAEKTILNHRNVGEDGPCLFTRDTSDLNDVLQNKPEVIKTDFKITLIKSTYKNGETCHLTLFEDIEANIRGYHFEHRRSLPLPDRVAEDC
tara:strand:+ start:2294 stop:2734 length:441 start_codon:yes stop_codon:yes gene_type:complete